MKQSDIYAIIGKVCGIEENEITIEADFFEDFNCEPNEMHELREIVEDRIGEKFEDEDFDAIITVNDLLRLIEEYGNEFIG